MSKVIIIQSEELGKGNDKLGRILMANFLRLLAVSEKKPVKIIFWNAGVKLLCKNSIVLEHLRQLEAGKVELLACTTCIEFYDLEEDMVIGKKSTMGETIRSMMEHETVTL